MSSEAAAVLSGDVENVVEVSDNSSSQLEEEGAPKVKGIATMSEPEAGEVSVTTNATTTSTDEITETVETVVEDISQTVELSDDTTLPPSSETVELGADAGSHAYC